MSAPPGPASKSRLINDLEVLRGFGLCVVIFHHLQVGILALLSGAIVSLAIGETAYRLGWNMDNQVLLSIAVCTCLIALVGNVSSQLVEWPIRRRGMAYTAAMMERQKSAAAAAT